MKCIFCLYEKPPSDEHVIPDSIGGTIHIKEVCRDCNSELSRLVDNPFASCLIIQLARYNHSIGGKRGNVPFPFGGVGTDETGLRVGVGRDFVPHVKRELQINQIGSDEAEVYFVADFSDVENFERMLGDPLRKKLVSLFPEWLPGQIELQAAAMVKLAKEQAPEARQPTVKHRCHIDLYDLLFEFLKIAYEIWFRRFGYPWVESSATAKNLREAILAHDASLPIKVKLLAPDLKIPRSDPATHHHILEVLGSCSIRLFNITCIV